MNILPVAGHVRDINGLVLPDFGEVVAMTSVTLPWRVASLPVPGDGEVVDEFLKDLTASDCSPATIRSYGYGSGGGGSLLLSGFDGPRRSGCMCVISCSGCVRPGVVPVSRLPPLTKLRFTPHDMRRIFATETVNGGLPLHIAQKLLVRLDLNTTQGYVAVYRE